MKDAALGRLAPVDLRTVWIHEADVWVGENLMSGLVIKLLRRSVAAIWRHSPAKGHARAELAYVETDICGR